MSAQGRDCFRVALREQLAPQLRKLGFRGSGQNFERIRGETINAINIQGSKDADGCFLNLGLHFSFLPSGWSISQRPVARWKEIDCEFRWRINPRMGEGSMWPYSESPVESTASVRELTLAYLQEGEVLFQRFSEPSDVARAVTLEALESGMPRDVPWGQTKVRAALCLARIHRRLGSLEASERFAQFGLRVLGSASGLRSPLQELAGAT